MRLIIYIYVFTKSGDIIRSFIKLEKGTGPIYLCFDLYNNIIVSDYRSNSIQIFTIEGQLIHKIVCESNPKGIAVDNLFFVFVMMMFTIHMYLIICYQ